MFAVHASGYRRLRNAAGGGDIGSSDMRCRRHARHYPKLSDIIRRHQATSKITTVKARMHWVYAHVCINTLTKTLSAYKLNQVMLLPFGTTAAGPHIPADSPTGIAMTKPHSRDDEECPVIGHRVRIFIANAKIGGTGFLPFEKRCSHAWACTLSGSGPKANAACLLHRAPHQPSLF